MSDTAPLNVNLPDPKLNMDSSSNAAGENNNAPPAYEGTGSSIPEKSPQRASQSYSAASQFEPLKATASNQTNETKNQFQGLASSVSKDNSNKRGPSKYHSFFYELFTWRYPRASALVFVLSIGAVLAVRFMNLFRFIFFGAWSLFACSAAVEFVSAFVSRGDSGFISQFRPAEPFTISRQSIEPLVSEGVELANFFVSEFQRVLFAENIKHTVLAFVVSFIAYELVTYMPLWGLFMVATVLLFSVPPIYIHNSEMIDSHLAKGQAFAAEHAKNARSFSSAKAQEAVDGFSKKTGVDMKRYFPSSQNQTASGEYEMKKSEKTVPSAGASATT